MDIEGLIILYSREIFLCLIAGALGFVLGVLVTM